MADTVTEFSVAMSLDADFEAEVEIANLLSGQYEVEYLGEWMTLNDVFTHWLLQVLPEGVRAVSTEIEPKQRWEGHSTTNQLNVRAQPGIGPNSPVIYQLTNGDRVWVYEEQLVDGEKWYRIGPNRWVHSQYIEEVWGRGGGSTGISGPARTRIASVRKPPSRLTPQGSIKPIGSIK